MQLRSLLNLVIKLVYKTRQIKTKNTLYWLFFFSSQNIVLERHNKTDFPYTVLYIPNITYIWKTASQQIMW